MYVHPDARLIYLAHPRTASVTTGNALKHVGFHKLEPPSDHHSRLWDEGTPVSAGNRHLWTVFTTVRNHWDAAVSWGFRRYSTRQGRQPREWTIDVLDWVLGESNRWVTDDRMWSLHSDDADIICRYESLDRDIGRVLSSRGVQVPNIPRFNVTDNREGRHYRDVLTPECRDYIAERFRKEIERFGYTY